MPKVSVVLPVRNGERFIPAAIESLLNQTFTDFEILVVDDASTDGTAAAVARLADSRIRYLRHDRQSGLPRALNAGLAAAAGAYVARLDHDDVAHPTRLARQTQVLDQQPAVALVGSRARRIDASGRARGIVERPVSREGIRWQAMLDNPFIHSATMFRRDVALAMGGYRDDVPLAEDFDLWSRIMASHEVGNLAEPLVDYREWSQSIMMNAAGEDGQAVLRRSLAAIIRRNVEATLGTSMSEEDAGLLASFTAGIQRADLERFFSVFDSLSEAFQRRHPAALAVRDYRKTVARAFWTISARLVPNSRLGAAAVFGHAVRSAPRIAMELPWMRAMASVSIGRTPVRKIAAASRPVGR